MKILYGIQGTGNGHITRARVMAEAFNRRPGVSVDYLFSGRQQDQYFDMQVFGDYQTRQGLSFVTINGQVSRLQTLKQANLVRFIKDVGDLDLSDYDLVINDFEPISAWAAKQQKCPSISISHQAAFQHPIPKSSQTWLDKIIMKHFAPTQYTLGVHWYHFGHAIIPPFVADEATRNNSPKKEVFSLVYLPFESPDLIQQTLQAISERQFKCFHPQVKAPYVNDNIQWFPPSKDGFKQALATCNAVIGNAGFELATECLHLGKPLMMKPLDGQFEQHTNAFTLTELGLSKTLYSLNTDDIDDWLQHTDAIQIVFPNNVENFIDWLIQGNWADTSTMCQSLWEQVKFPNNIQQKLASLK